MIETDFPRTIKITNLKAPTTVDGNGYSLIHTATRFSIVSFFSRFIV